MNCSKRGCEWKATHYIGFRAWAIGANRETNQAFRGTLSLMLCKTHAVEACSVPEMLITDDNWMHIEFAMACHSRQKADRKSVELRPVRGKPDRKSTLAPRVSQRQRQQKPTPGAKQ